MKKLMYHFALIFAFLISLNAYSQNAPFRIGLEPVSIANLGGIQSYAFGQHNGKWLIIGGRLDGLHRRQPFASFDAAGHNIQLIVVDPVSLQKWSAPLTTLSIPLQEQLKSTNMQFQQEGDYLYLTGGYGYSATLGDHTTFDKLTAVDVPNTIDAIVNNSSFVGYFRQITDPAFQLTGGHLEKIYDVFHLVGGQKFIGRYNPMGPTSGPGFIQEYSCQDRRFKINDDGTTITITHLPSITDLTNLHRRDYNVITQIMPNGQEGLTAFSGVFQPTVDLPYLNCVNIDSNSAVVNNAFSQHYNHYHCANVPLYSAANNEMHNVFFGGIAQYYDSAGILIQDNNVPFVKTIARVTRNASGIMSEYKLANEMPALLGAGSEFIPVQGLPVYPNHVFKLDDFTADSTLIGYIYGGISSSAPNIFFINTGVESVATSEIFKVYLLKGELGLDELNKQSVGTLKLVVFPNPNDGIFTVQYNLSKASDVHIILRSVDGKIVNDERIKNQAAGQHLYEEKSRKLRYIGEYLLTIETDYETATQMVVIGE